MIYIIIVLAILLVASILYICWTFFSKTQKSLNAKKVKAANQERKIILSNAYQEINNQKNSFEKEKELKMYELDQIKLRLENDQKSLEKQRELLNYQEDRVNLKNVDLEKRALELENKISDVVLKLETIASLTQDEAKQILLKLTEEKIQNEIVAIIKNAEVLAHKRAKELSTAIIVEAMEKYKTDIVNEKTTNIVKLPAEEMKGRIIGREGRNLKAFEQYGGVEIVVDETPNSITVSSFNPIRREIVTRALNKLMNDGRIQPVKIEQELIKQEKELEEIMIEEGYKTIQELEITDIDFELIKLIGRLKYRSSYGQNVLLHSIETAKIAGSIASELKLDSKKAIRAGLLHDIGKAVDFEQDGSHVEIGVALATKYGEDPIIINTIASHHEGVAKDSEIAVIVAVADAISAARPGARNMTLSDFFIRMDEIEKIGNSIPGVAKTYAFQSGRQIRVIVDPLEVSDIEMYKIVDQLKTKLNESVIIPGEITITVIREKREVSII